jgi:iron complex outermembrane recepter protein
VTVPIVWCSDGISITERQLRSTRAKYRETRACNGTSTHSPESCKRLSTAASTRAYYLLASLLAISCGAPEKVFAQRAGDNAVTDAEDAFGTQVDQQSIGLYSPDDARGFSPQLAGNLRLDGLYVAQVHTFINPCLIRETNMRVGFSADPFNFPAPTGVVDMALRTPGGKQVMSVLATHGSLDGETATFEAQVPLTDSRLAVDVCAAYHHNNDIDYSDRAHGFVRSVVAQWRPSETIEVVPFAAVADGGEQNLFPLVYGDGVSRPPAFDLNDLATSDQTTYGWRHIDAGLVAHAAYGDKWSLAAGVFRSEEHDPSNSNPLYFLEPSAIVDIVLDQSPRLRSGAWSGEIRGVHEYRSGSYSQKLALAVRGRTTKIQFGGDEILDLGSASIFQRTLIPAYGGPFGLPSYDNVNQHDFGITYEMKRQDVGSVTLGVLRDQYERSVEQPDSDVASQSKSRWLVTARVVAEFNPSTMLYISEVQGVEDSPLAPASAVNRGELPTASRTRQVDFGLRLGSSRTWQSIVGGFEIRKPYFNLDELGFYRALGDLRHRGIEASTSFSSRGVTLVAGGVYLLARDERGTTTERTVEVPLGPVPGTLNVNLDVAPKSWNGWGASVQWKWLSARDVTSDGTSRLPPLSTLNIGGRYYHRSASHPWSVRLDAFNIGDRRGLHVSNVGQLLPEQPRRIVLTVALDCF